MGIIPAESLQAPAKSEVIFEKFGANLYFDRVLIQGDTRGVLAQATKTEKRAEEAASVAEEHSVIAYGQ
jgi:hypothetical protein